MYKKTQLRNFWLTICIGVIFFSVGDFLFSLATVNGSYTLGSLPDVFYASYYIFIGIGLAIIIIKRTEYTIITPQKEVDCEQEPLERLPAGQCCLVKEVLPESSYMLLKNELNQGAEGLIVTRTFPMTIRKANGIELTPIIWLTNVKGEGNMMPENLRTLTDVILRFIEEAKDNVVMIDALDALILYNGFTNTMKMMNQLRDHAAIYKSKVLLSINPKALNPNEMAILLRAVDTVINIDENSPCAKKNTSTLGIRPMDTRAIVNAMREYS